MQLHALSTILNKKIRMKVPNVRMMTFDEIVEMAGGAENVVAEYLFSNRRRCTM